MRKGWNVTLMDWTAYKQKHCETEGMWEIKGCCMYYSLLPLVTESVRPWPQSINTTFDYPKIIHNHSIQHYRNVNYQYLNLNTHTHTCSKINKSVKMQCCDHKNIHSQSSACLSALGILKWLSSCLCQNPNGKTRITWQMADQRTAVGRKYTLSWRLEGADTISHLNVWKCQVRNERIHFITLPFVTWTLQLIWSSNKYICL